MKTLMIISAIIAMFLTILILDYLWLGVITKNFIIKEFGNLINVKNGSIKVNLFVGILAWLAIVLGCLIFSVLPSETLTKTIVLGATFGMISYAIYDLTNLTFIKDYPLKFALVDILWGTFLCSVVSGVGFFIKNLF